MNQGVIFMSIAAAIILILVGLFCGYYFWYRCNGWNWTLSSNALTADTSITLVSTGITECTAKSIANSNNYPAFYLVSNVSGKNDAYFFASGTTTITTNGPGKDYLFTTGSVTVNPSTGSTTLQNVTTSTLQNVTSNPYNSASASPSPSPSPSASPSPSPSAHA
jgi:hypothetical protein